MGNTTETITDLDKSVILNDSTRMLLRKMEEHFCAQQRNTVS